MLEKKSNKDLGSQIDAAMSAAHQGIEEVQASVRKARHEAGQAASSDLAASVNDAAAAQAVSDPTDQAAYKGLDDSHATEATSYVLSNEELLVEAARTDAKLALGGLDEEESEKLKENSGIFNKELSDRGFGRDLEIAKNIIDTPSNENISAITGEALFYVKNFAVEAFDHSIPEEQRARIQQVLDSANAALAAKDQAVWKNANADSMQNQEDIKSNQGEIDRLANLQDLGSQSPLTDTKGASVPSPEEIGELAKQVKEEAEQIQASNDAYRNSGGSKTVADVEKDVAKEIQERGNSRYVNDAKLDGQFAVFNYQGQPLALYLTAADRDLVRRGMALDDVADKTLGRYFDNVRINPQLSVQEFNAALVSRDDVAQRREFYAAVEKGTSPENVMRSTEGQQTSAKEENPRVSMDLSQISDMAMDNYDHASRSEQHELDNLNNKYFGVRG